MIKYSIIKKKLNVELTKGEQLDLAHLSARRLISHDDKGMMYRHPLVDQRLGDKSR